jgi:tetratricopeptide (TPR) repeat protein
MEAFPLDPKDSIAVTSCKNEKRSYQDDINLFHHLNDHTKNLEDCIIVWLDLWFYAKPHHIEKLRAVVNYLKIFDNIDDCMQYVSAIKQEHVFLIVSGRTGKHIIPLVHNLSQLNSIYIFCIKAQTHRIWSSKYPKVKGVFIAEETLYDRLSKDVILCSSQTPMSIIQFEHTLNTLNKDEKPLFLWSQILLQVILRLPPSSNGKQDMINQARDQYCNNLIEQQKINEFEGNYSSDTAIKWYTRDCFVYRLVNKALRTENIDNIFLYRFFIADLYRQLERLHLSYVPNDNSSILTCYRGQLLTINEFEKLKSSINEYISINTFFSTSISSSVAVTFFINGEQQYDTVSVLFEILVDTTIQTKPFAPIHNWSVNTDEDEVLFTMGTIFKIESCEDFDGFWHVKLTLSTEPDLALKSLLNHYEIKIGETSSLLIFGEFLHKMNELDKAERYYQLLTRELPSDHVDVGMAFNNIGTIYTDRGEYKKAKSYLRRALNIFRRTSHVDNLNVAEIYLNFATVYGHMENAKTALKHEKKALQIQLKILPDNHLTLATTYNNIADTYDSLNKKATALKYYYNALEIELQHLPPNHSDLAVTYNNMASVYIDMHDYQCAREYLTKAFEIRKYTLPSWHPDLADSYRLLATLSAEADDTSDALEKYQESLRILLSTPSQVLDHHRIYQVHSDIGGLLFQRQFFQSALKSYKMSLYHLKQCDFVKPFDKSIVYNNFAAVYVEVEKYNRAKKYCRKSLRAQCHCQNVEQYRNRFNSRLLMAKIFHAQKSDEKALVILKKLLYQQRRLIPHSYNELCNVYKTMHHVYLDKKNYKKSEQYVKKSMRIRLKFMPERKIDVAFDYEELATIYMKISLPKQAIKWYKKAINVYLTAKPPPPSNLSSAYFYLGQTFLSIKKYSKAKMYLIKARKLRQENLSPHDLQIAIINIELGRLEYSRKKFQMATKYYQLALSIYEQQPRLVHSDLIYLHNLLGMSFTAEQKFDQAMYHCRKVLQISKERISTSSDEDEQIDMIIAKVYGNIAEIYLHDNKLQKALKNARTSLKLTRQYPTRYFNLSNSLLLMGSVYRKKELYKRALTFLQRARLLTSKCADEYQIELFPYIYAELGICYDNMAHHRHRIAYKYYKLAENASLSSRDENFRQDIKENIERLQNQYENLLEI